MLFYGEWYCQQFVLVKQGVVCNKGHALLQYKLQVSDRNEFKFCAKYQFLEACIINNIFIANAFCRSALQDIDLTNLSISM